MWRRKSARRAAGRPYILFGAILFVLAWFFGGIESYFTDNLYNKALVARSALADGPALETSYKHWFFDARPAVRPEDWHRSASLLAYSQLARLWPGQSDELVRIVHALMFTLWGLMVVALGHALTARKAAERAPPDIAAPRIAGVIFLGAVLLMPFVTRVAMDIYLDDLPAALMAMAACGLLFAPGFRWWRVAAAGACAGAAFWMKDLYLVWVVCAPPVAWTLTDPGTAGNARTPERRLAAVALFTTVMLAVAGGKIWWNIVELDQALPDQARIALNARLIRGLADAENQFFHHMPGLDAPLSYAATMLDNNPAALFFKHGLATLTALRDNGLIAMFLVIAAGAVLTNGLHSPSRRILRATIVITVAFGIFFTAGMGEAGQLRYWLVPLSGALAMTAALIRQGLATVNRRHGAGRQRRLMQCLWAVLVFAALPQGISTLAATYGKPPPLTDEFMANTARHARPGETILVQLHKGVWFWSRYPQLSFTGISAGATEAASCKVLHAVVREARARVAAVTHPPVAEKLKDCGFKVIQQTDHEALLAPPPTAARLSRSYE